MEDTKLYKSWYEKEAREIIWNKTDAELKAYLKELEKNKWYWLDKWKSGYSQIVENDIIRYYLEKKETLNAIQNSDILKKIQSSYKEGKSIIDLDIPEKQMYFDGFTVIDWKPMVKISEVWKFYGSKLRQKDTTISPDEFIERYKYVWWEMETKSISKKLIKAELDDSNIMKRYYREDYKKALEWIKKKTP